MSNEAKKIKKVQVKESDLVALMDNIVTEAVKDAKAKFIAEQAETTKKANDLLESRIANLEAALKG
jgi:DNA-binding protein YbaB